jgi:hypothetical protein
VSQNRTALQYVALAAVLIGVAGESIEEFTDWPKKWGFDKPLTRLSALILIAGLAGEGMTQFNTNGENATLVALLNKQVAVLEAEQTMRHLRPEQKSALITALSPFRGQKVELWCLVSAFDCNTFAEELREVFRQASWSVPPNIVGLNGSAVGRRFPRGI